MADFSTSGQASDRRRQKGEQAATSISASWIGPHYLEACKAALEYGYLVAAKLLTYDRAMFLLRRNFELRKIDPDRWQDARDAFGHGASIDAKLNDAWKLYGSNPANDNNRFDVTWFDDVDQVPAKEEIVKGFLGAGEFSLFVAKPGTAKSVLLCDIGCHIAAGRDWHGRKVKQGMVVFFAAERKRLTERRVAAWRKRHEIEGIPFVVAGGKLDLTSGLVDAKALATAIQSLEAKAGHQCTLVILDTVTRTFGGGDQNASKDMQRYIASVDELHRATSAHIAAIHHSGWESDRGKGAIDLDGAVDASFGITVSGKGESKSFVLECTGANDADEGVITGFRLESVALGVDADGNETTAPVVISAKVVPDDGSNLKSNADKVLDALQAVIEASGQERPSGSPELPDGVLAAPRHAWRNRFLLDAQKREPDAKPDTLDRIFRRGVADLAKAGKVNTTEDWFWPDGGQSPDMSGQ